MRTRPTPLARLLAAAFLLTFVGTGLAAAAGFKACPHHDSEAATEQGAHAGHAMPDHGADAPADEHTPCTCPNMAACGVAVALAASPAGAASVITSVVVSAPEPPAADFVPAPTPHLLPWATAPPVV